jgi:glyoxylase-like metal-dependent hydrolase (beta-lactamase superfamily II)
MQIRTERIAPNFYALTGSPGVDPAHPDAAGGTIGVLTGPDGVLMVDASYYPVTGKVVAAIRTITLAPIRYLVNTHFHIDHTGGNANVAGAGALLFARQEVYDELQQLTLPPVALEAAGPQVPARLPVVTYRLGQSVTLRMNDEVVDLIPVAAAHTTGDTMVRFEHADLVMVGDFFRSYGYPFIDTDNGGTLNGTLDALDAVLKLAGPHTRIVPGHGVIVGVSAVAAQRDLILRVKARVAELIREGKTLDQVVAAKPTRPYDAFVPGAATLAFPFDTTADRFVATLYTELQRAAH